MSAINDIKMAIYEASEEKLIDRGISDNMLAFCETADLNNPEDVDMLKEMCDTLITVAESAKDKSHKSDANSIRLSIFESEAAGEITAEERDELLAMM